jgi:hypothetical protein
MAEIHKHTRDVLEWITMLRNQQEIEKNKRREDGDLTDVYLVI